MASLTIDRYHPLSVSVQILVVSAYDDSQFIFHRELFPVAKEAGMSSGIAICSSCQCVPAAGQNALKGDNFQVVSTCSSRRRSGISLLLQLRCQPDCRHGRRSATHRLCAALAARARCIRLYQLCRCYRYARSAEHGITRNIWLISLRTSHYNGPYQAPVPDVPLIAICRSVASAGGRCIITDAEIAISRQLPG